MSPIAYAIPIFMLSILAEFLLARRRAPGAYDIADGVTSLHFGVLSQIAGAFTYLLTIGIYSWTFEHFRLATLPQNEWWVWVLALLFYDFCYYWAHRAGHEINLFWAAHQVHHSSEYYNLTTALRQTATGAFTSWPFYLVMALAGVPPFVFGVVALIDLLYQYWVHTQLVGKLGPLDRILVTPSNHRVHHGQNDYCLDRNYGGIFIFWDRLFGTFVEERDDEPIVYGIRSPLASYDPVWGNLNVYRDIARRSTAALSVWQAIRVWFEPPAGRGKQPPPMPADFRRYDSTASLSARRYALWQYVLLIAPATHFIAIARQLDWVERGQYALILIAWVWSLSNVLEARAQARLVETLRVVVTAALLFFSATWFGLSMDLIWRALVALLMLLPLWSLHRDNQAATPTPSSRSSISA